VAFIWYFDLSDVKVAKKTPFTRRQLSEFFELLPARADSDRSWTLDIAARRRGAKDEADALRATAQEPKSRLRKHREGLDRLKKAKAGPEAQEPVKQLIADCERKVRAIDAKAQSLEDAAFDLKAVNPNARVEEDTRSPAELIALIERHGREVRDLLEKLKAL